MKIEVTERDIERGLRKFSECPIYHALCRAFPDEEIAVDRAVIIVGTREDSTPDDATDFIDAFDAGEPVQPFTFNLNL